MTIDLLPTIAKLTGTKLPKHKNRCKNIWPLISGQKDAKSPQEAYYFYSGRSLQAVRAGRWKLHFPHGYRTMKGSKPGKGGRPGRYRQEKIGLALYDLENDIGELKNVADANPKS